MTAAIVAPWPAPTPSGRIAARLPAECRTGCHPVAILPPARLWPASLTSKADFDENRLHEDAASGTSMRGIVRPSGAWRGGELHARSPGGWRPLGLRPPPVRGRVRGGSAGPQDGERPRPHASPP